MNHHTSLFTDPQGQISQVDLNERGGVPDSGEFERVCPVDTNDIAIASYRTPSSHLVEDQKQNGVVGGKSTFENSVGMSCSKQPSGDSYSDSEDNED